MLLRRQRIGQQVNCTCQPGRGPTVSYPTKVFSHERLLFVVPFMTEQPCLPVTQRDPIAMDLTERFAWIAGRCEIRRHRTPGVNPKFRTRRHSLVNSIVLSPRGRFAPCHAPLTRTAPITVIR